MYQDMVSKKRPWIKFKGFELLFRCEGCECEEKLDWSRVHEENAEEQATEFSNKHALCGKQCTDVR